jgi:hypothetical protein
MRFAWLALIAAIGCGDDGPPLTVAARFVVENRQGIGPSVLDPLYQQTVELYVGFPTFEVAYAGDPVADDCQTTTLSSDTTERSAKGATAGLVQTELLDKLTSWELRFLLCKTTTSSIVLRAGTPSLDFSIGCFGVPPAAIVRDADGFPLVTSFTATLCNGTIQDALTNRVLGNLNFSMTMFTGPETVP